MQLACIIEGPWVRHAGAMLHSVLQHSAPVRATVHVLHESPIAPTEQASLREVVAAFGGELRWHTLEAEAVAPFPGGYFPRSVWFRVLLPELLPELDRVLYLDADLIAADSLQTLWETPLGEHLLAAVTNPLYPFMPPYPATALDIREPADYLNSGVLLFNLAQMRRENTARQLVDFARNHPQLWYPDQDALNVVCRGRWLHLHPRWNAQSTFFQLSDADLPLPAAQSQEARRNPALVHFIGPFKPWTYMCRHPLRALYFEHARQTPWGAPPLAGKTLRTILLRPLPFRLLDRWLSFEHWLERQRSAARRLPGRVLRRVRRVFA